MTKIDKLPRGKHRMDIFLESNGITDKPILKIGDLTDKINEIIDWINKMDAAILNSTKLKEG